MSVRIRLSRFGRTHRPFFRIVAIDRRCHREGTANEVLGSYDPLLAEKNVTVDMDRVNAWLSQGAEISDSVAALLKRDGYELPKAVVKAAKGKRRRSPKGDGKTFVKASRRAVQKHAAKVKAVRKEETAAALAKKQAEAAAAAPAAAPAE